MTPRSGSNLASWSGYGMWHKGRLLDTRWERRRLPGGTWVLTTTARPASAAGSRDA